MFVLICNRGDKVLKSVKVYIAIFVLLLGIIFVIAFANLGQFKKSSDKIPDTAKIKSITFFNYGYGKVITKEADIKKIMALVDSKNIVGIIPSRGSVAGAMYSIKIKYKDIFANDQIIVFYGDTINLIVQHKINIWYQLKTEVSSPMLDALYKSFK